MAAIIDFEIPKQGFEIVSERIGQILFEEISNQIQTYGFTENVEIYSERITPIGNDEEVVINILASSASYSSQTRSDIEGATRFYVDIYCNKGQEDGKTGDENTSSLMLKYLGIVRYIMSFPDYVYLGLDEPRLVGGGQVESWEIQEPDYDQNTDFNKFARMVLAYRVNESVEFLKGVPLQENHTTVKLELTEKGYKFVKIF